MQVQLILQCHKLEDIKISIKFDYTKKVTLLFKILYGETKLKTTLNNPKYFNFNNFLSMILLNF